jgi:hypothetical protein
LILTVECTCIHLAGADPGFQVRGEDLKKLRRAEGGPKNFGVFRVKNLTIYLHSELINLIIVRNENFWFGKNRVIFLCILE